MFFIPRNAKGNYDWNAIADGRYYVEWYAGGTRRRVSAGVTVQRRKHHALEDRKLGIPGFETAGEPSAPNGFTDERRGLWKNGT